MKNLFLFTFDIPQSNVNDIINCSVFAEDYEGACYIILGIGLPISVTDIEDLSSYITSVLQVTDEDAKV